MSDEANAKAMKEIGASTERPILIAFARAYLVLHELIRLEEIEGETTEETLRRILRERESLRRERDEMRLPATDEDARVALQEAGRRQNNSISERLAGWPEREAAERRAAESFRRLAALPAKLADERAAHDKTARAWAEALERIQALEGELDRARKAESAMVEPDGTRKTV